MGTRSVELRIPKASKEPRASPVNNPSNPANFTLIQTTVNSPAELRDPEVPPSSNPLTSGTSNHSRLSSPLRINNHTPWPCHTATPRFPKGNHRLLVPWRSNNSQRIPHP